MTVILRDSCCAFLVKEIKRKIAGIFIMNLIKNFFNFVYLAFMYFLLLCNSLVLNKM